MCVFLVAFKAWLIPRLAFHWDEFWFLSQVHAGWRGELNSPFQAFHVLAMGWLPGMGDEIAQLRAGRWVGWGGLVASTGLAWALARRWCSPHASWLAALALLGSWPAMVHGGEFRSDAFLLPLSMGTLVALAHARGRTWPLWLAGAAWGLAMAFTVKAIFLAPCAAAMLWAGGWEGTRRWGVGVAWVGTAGMAALAVSLGFQHLALEFTPGAGGDIGQALGESGREMFGRWWPHSDQAWWLARRDAATWMGISGGLALALARRMPLAGLALSLVPIAFYQNSFMYYYVAMLAPACVLVAWTGHVAMGQGRWGRGLAWIMACGLIFQGGFHALRLAGTTHQAHQAQVLSVVHQVFEQPVRYIDHSGVLPGFTKANPFMSQWGVNTYRKSEQAFMPGLLGAAPAPLMLADRDILVPGSWRHAQLLDDDARLISQAYIPYWGPIWVAGKQLPSDGGNITVPMAGSYRLEADTPVMVDGQMLRDGQVLVVRREQRLSIAWMEAPRGGRLVWAQARRAPRQEPASDAFFLRPR